MTTQTTSRSPALAVARVPATAPAAVPGTVAGDLEGPAVRVRDVRREFGGRVVLDGIDLDIAAGEFVALLGRSGSGKSTLLRILAGLDAAATGRATVPERSAVVFQDPRLLPWARVVDNVTLGLKGREARGQARDALAEVGLAGRERDWPATLSGGEAQRAALARALVRSPGLLLLDEPFGALDALTRIRMHRLLRDLCRRHRPAVLLVTHDVDEAILLADRVAVLTDGQLSHDERVRLSHDEQGRLSGARHRSDPQFAALRARLLAELGVSDDEAESRPGAAPDATTEIGDA
ncbi:ABC transporter ATP-binding protein [Frankia sp. AgB1.9]|uniref:ABC transporter ATP-binding protein n=1 Tax=unclassified Frankia TaxID=2632575 RepID=UPI001931D5F1|nr:MULTISPECIES: ABC transporter ATP-binding protein [unclassified Frankia]MBL7494067.1 ABC transporter ATP-binding protein [Frankia sp. AgW1.1]MBL7549355.1 ABC transporter ATP-binding protein [Frankia sp. AgB1.9]MBL7623388.1 ABC transporter ATP-binding protein [Frankia sp. AgB1.8]